MKRFLLTLGLVLISLLAFSQHIYIVQIKDIDNSDTAKYCTQIFKELRALDVEFIESSKTFTVKTKTFLSKMIVEDYFSASGYTVINFFETNKSKELIILPKK